MTSPIDPNKDARLAELLRDYDELRERQVETPGGMVQETPLSPDDRAELAEAQECLDLIDRVVRQQVDTPTQILPDADWGEQRSGLTNDLDEVPARIGRFSIRQLLGRGGFGVVYLAQDPDLDRLVALKIPRPEALLSSDARERFDREAKTAAILSHPAIVPIYESGRIGPVSYVAFAYCRGVSLAEWFAKQDRQISHRLAAKIVARLADAVMHAHRRGVVHRDLKPSNILLDGIIDGAPDGDADIVASLRVTDFGLAKTKASGEDLTRTGAIVGTPAYMSPEQARGSRDVGPTADIYALGNMLYELMAGRLPLRRDGELATIKAIESDLPPSPRQFNPCLPRDLESICLKCLEKSPADRYATALELQEDLENFVAGRPVVARPVTVVSRVRKWAQRNPLPAGLVSALLVAILAGEILFGWQFQNALAANRELGTTNDLLIEQRNTARIAKQEAEQNLTIERAVTDFLLQSFRSPDPNLDGRSITVASVLDRSVENPVSDSTMDPLTRAHLLVSIGNSYRDLGLMGRAVDVLEKSQAVYDEHLPKADINCLAMAGSLGMAYVESKDWRKAVPLLEDALQTAESTCGPDVHVTQWLTNNLALAYHASGNPERGLTIIRSLYEQQMRDLGSDHIDTVQTTDNLAFLLQSVGKVDESIPLLETLIQKNREVFGARGPETLKVLNNLANAYRATRQFNRAMQLFEETLVHRITVLGEDHPETLGTENDIAGVLMMSGQIDRAVDVLERLLPRSESVLGKDHFMTIGIYNNLGGGYLWQNQPEKAAPFFELAWQKMSSLLGPNHPSTLRAYKNLGQAQEDAGRLDEADRIYRELIAIDRQQEPPKPGRLAGLLAMTGRTLLKQEHYQEAEPLLRECLEVHTRQDRDDWRVARATSLLGASLLGQGKHAKAEPLLLDGYDGLTEHEDKLPAGRRKTMLEEAVRRIVELYDLKDDAENAAIWPKKLDPASRGPDDDPK